MDKLARLYNLIRHHLFGNPERGLLGGANIFYAAYPDIYEPYLTIPQLSAYS